MHQLKDQRQASGWSIKHHLLERDDVGMRGQSSQGLDLPKIVHLANAREGTLHALDGVELVIVCVLSLDDFRKRPLPSFANEPVSAHHD